MPARHAICLFIDGLRASALGAYGGAGVATPSLDRLAGASLVADWAWAAGPTIENFYDAVATGLHPLRRPLCSDPLVGPGLFTALRKGGVQLDLVTDSGPVAHRLDATGQFDVQLLDLPIDGLAPTVEATRMSQLLAVAAEHWLSSDLGRESRMLWIHAAAWHGPWDAPLAIRESLLAEDGLQPSTVVDVSMDPGAEDPDELLIARTAYAAETVVLDECLEGFLTAVESSAAASETLLVVGGTRGFALGEHGQYGRDRRPCYGEFLHIPLLVRLPGTTAPLPRDGGLRSPCDITPTLLDWLLATRTASSMDGQCMLAAKGGGSHGGGRRWNVCFGADDLALRTPAWMLRQSGVSEGGEGTGIELYAKPDDRWEANEIADRCPEVVEAALALLAELQSAAKAGRSFDEIHLADVLLDLRR